MKFVTAFSCCIVCVLILAVSAQAGLICRFPGRGIRRAVAQPSWRAVCRGKRRRRLPVQFGRRALGNLWQHH